MHAIILSIGDELILGQTLDTNSQWMSQQLAANGCDIAAHMTVADDQAAIEQAIRLSAPRCDVLLISGGIGPTADDLTRQALAAVLDCDLVMNQEWLTELDRFFRQRQRPMPEQNKIQAMIPRKAQMIWNHAGTAAGLRATIESLGIGVQGSGKAPSLNSSCEVFVMPGVPKEMKTMFQRDVLPFIQQRAAGAVILSTTLHTFGLGESAVAQMLGDLMMRQRNPSVGTTVSAGLVSLRVNARYASRAEAQQQLDLAVAQCKQALGDLIFGADEQTLQEMVGGMLKARQHTVTTAESCTGGLLAKYLTDVSGSSDYFRQGWVTYANEAKTQLLGVDPAILAQHGAVSEPVVTQMAQAAAEKAKATHALAISGVAGPTGGTAAKPVGTVCIALASQLHGAGPMSTTARTFSFPGDRELIRDRACKMALTLLRYHLLGKPLPF